MIAVEVPLDAYMMDFVFSEREDGGIYDNKNEMDYHIPVSGGTSKEPPMNIVHVAVEMAPIAKVFMISRYQLLTNIKHIIYEIIYDDVIRHIGILVSEWIFLAHTGGWSWGCCYESFTCYSRIGTQC